MTIFYWTVTQSFKQVSEKKIIVILRLFQILKILNLIVNLLLN